MSATIIQNGIFGVVCPFHSIDKLENYSILKCEYQLFDYVNEWRHIIHFKDPITDDGTLKNTNGLILHYNESNLITKLEESVSYLPINTLYCLKSNNSPEVLNSCVEFLIQYILFYSTKNLVNKLLISSDPHAFAYFLQTIGVNVTADKQLAFVQNFRFLTMRNCKNKVLLKQIFSIINLIKTFLYTTRRSAKPPNTTYDCKNCKLKKLNERFLNYNYATFHSVYCQPKDYNTRWEILQKITPFHMHHLLDEAKSRLTVNTAATRKL